MPRIFISYRRADSRLVVNRIYDRLTAAFGKAYVFKDVDSIPAGRDFRGVIRNATADCQVMLVVIGPNWVSAADADGRRRLDDPGDFARIEVESGLQRDGITIIPLLVEGASMPSPDQLPESLRELSYNNAFTIHDDPLFHHDMDTLIASLRVQLPRRRALIWWIALLAVFALAITALLMNIRTVNWTANTLTFEHDPLTSTAAPSENSELLSSTENTSPLAAPVAVPPVNPVSIAITKPVVTILSPQDGAEFVVGTPILVSAHAVDSQGITSIRLYANRVPAKSLDTESFGGVTSMDVLLDYTPVDIGSLLLQVVALHGESSSDPAEIIVQVRADWAQVTATQMQATGVPYIDLDDVTCRALIDAPVSFRTGPGVRYDRIKVVATGTIARIVGWAGNSSWYQVFADGLTGWVSGSHVTLYGDCSHIAIVETPPPPTLGLLTLNPILGP